MFSTYSVDRFLVRWEEEKKGIKYRLIDATKFQKAGLGNHGPDLDRCIRLYAQMLTLQNPFLSEIEFQKKLKTYIVQTTHLCSLKAFETWSQYVLDSSNSSKKQSATGVNGAKRAFRGYNKEVLEAIQSILLVLVYPSVKSTLQVSHMSSTTSSPSFPIGIFGMKSM